MSSRAHSANFMLITLIDATGLQGAQFLGNTSPGSRLGLAAELWPNVPARRGTTRGILAVPRSHRPDRPARKKIGKRRRSRHGKGSKATLQGADEVEGPALFTPPGMG